MRGLVSVRVIVKTARLPGNCRDTLDRSNSSMLWMVARSSGGRALKSIDWADAAGASAITPARPKTTLIQAVARFESTVYPACGPVCGAPCAGLPVLMPIWRRGSSGSSTSISTSLVARPDDSGRLDFVAGRIYPFIMSQRIRTQYRISGPVL